MNCNRKEKKKKASDDVSFRAVAKPAIKEKTPLLIIPKALSNAITKRRKRKMGKIKQPKIATPTAIARPIKTHTHTKNPEKPQCLASRQESSR